MNCRSKSRAKESFMFGMKNISMQEVGHADHS
jgi:hypothetical protein